MQQDVIIGCIDDPDISIRLQALDLGAGMVNKDNVIAVVERLMRQLCSASIAPKAPCEGRSQSVSVKPAADSDGEDLEEALRPTAESRDKTVALPAEYRNTVVHRILDMCSKDTYKNIVDFEWYIDILHQLVKLMPTAEPPVPELYDSSGRSLRSPYVLQEADASTAIGWELRNVAVRVSTVRAKAVKVASSLLGTSGSEGSFPIKGSTATGVLGFVAWVVGEYIGSSVSPSTSLESLMHPDVKSLSPPVLCAYLQAILKLLTFIASHELLAWSSEHKTMLSLLVARIINFLERFVIHPSLEVQERSVEFLELMKVAFQAIVCHGLENDWGPLFLTRAVPQLFTGFQLNAVAPTAQRKVPLPDDLDLGVSINKNLPHLLQLAEQCPLTTPDTEEFGSFYNNRSNSRITTGLAFEKPSNFASELSSYQRTGNGIQDTDLSTRKRNERRERNRDDPFYIGYDDVSSGTTTPFRDITRSTQGVEIDLDSIPIMHLDLGDKTLSNHSFEVDISREKRKRPKRFEIAKDENIEQDDPKLVLAERAFAGTINDSGPFHQARDKIKKSLLEVDSSGLNNYSLHQSESATGQLNVERQEIQDIEMARALAEVERLRLEMQRASERIQATDGTPAEGTMVIKKKKKKKKREEEVDEEKTTKSEQAAGDIEAKSGPFS